MKSLNIEPLGTAIGARITKFSLSQVPTAMQRDEIETALERYGVLVFPDQSLQPGAQVAFSRAFAELLLANNAKARHAEYPEVLTVGNTGSTLVSFSPSEPGERLEWHADHMHVERPARASLLYALQVPEVGGETYFACMYSAYGSLSRVEQEQAAGLTAQHCASGLRRFLDDYADPAASKPDYVNGAPVVRWPLVRHHPRSGRSSLYFGSHVTIGIDDWPAAKAQQYIERLTAIATREENVYVHRWTVGDAVLWDNRRVLHAGGAYDVHKHRREMHRTTWAEDRPIV